MHSTKYPVTDHSDINESDKWLQLFKDISNEPDLENSIDVVSQTGLF